MGFRIGLSIALLIGIPACSRTQPIAPMAVTSTTAEVVPSPIAPPAKVGSPTLLVPRVLNYISKGRRLLLHIDWELIRNSKSYPLFDKFLVRMYDEELKEVEEVCKLSLASIVSTFTIAWQESPDDDDFLFAFTADATKDQLIACASARGHAEIAGTKLAEAYWPEPNMILFKEGAKASDLEQEMDDGALINDSAFMTELLTFHNPITAIWALGIFSDSLRKNMQSGFGGTAAPTHFTMQVELEVEVDAVLTMYFEKLDEAKAMENQLTQLLPMLKSIVPTDFSELVNYVSVDHQDHNVRILLRLSHKEAEALLKTANRKKTGDDPCANSADPLCGL